MLKDFVESSIRFNGKINKPKLYRVCALNRISKNHRLYTNEALDSLVVLGKEGVKAFIDHSYGDSPHGVMQLLGVFTNFRREGGSVYADLEAFKSSPGYDLLFDIAENHPDACGFSIACRGRFDDQPDDEGREVVREIVSLRSIDLVSQPASTTTLWEQESEELTQLRLTIKKLQSLNQELQKKLKSRPVSSFKKSGPNKTPVTKESFWASLNDIL